MLLFNCNYLSVVRGSRGGVAYDICGLNSHSSIFLFYFHCIALVDKTWGCALPIYMQFLENRDGNG